MKISRALITTASWLVTLLMSTSGCANAALAAGAELPPSSLKVPPMVKENSVSVYLPSDAAPGAGLAVNVIYPAKPRYKDGAPVVVVVPGGNQTSGLDFSTHAAQQGFIEVRFAFPGGGKKDFESSGIYDQRGHHSQEALRDVLKFAAGKLPDADGKTISDLVKVKVYNNTVGVVGWSNGGNLALVTLSKFAADLPFIGWLAFYESPIGSCFYPPSLGGAQDFLTLKHYRQGTAATGQILIDFKKLRWQKNGTRNPGAHKKVGEPEIPGVLYFDENDNKVWEETSEFALPYSTDLGLDKQIYPPLFLKPFLKLPSFQKKWPETLATVAEAEAYFKERDGSLYLKDLLQKYPELPVTIIGTQLDHLQRQPDHPHIAFLYNMLLDERPKFVRLNPDPVYVGQSAGMRSDVFRANKPNSPIEADEIASHLEHEGLLPDYVYVEASIAELSDRVKLGKFNKTLAEPLVTYSNGAKPPEPKPEAKDDAKPSTSTSTKTEVR